MYGLKKGNPLNSKKIKFRLNITSQKSQTHQMGLAFES